MKKLLSLTFALLLSCQTAYSAVTFDDSNDILTCGALSDSVMTENGTLTISSWINPTAVGRIVARESSATVKVRMTFSLAALAVNFVVAGSTALTRQTADSTIATSTWQHVVMTWDGSVTATNVKFYINNVEPSYGTTTNGVTPTDNSADSITIGAQPGPANVLGGDVTEVAIFNRVLDRTEIAQLYGNGSVPKGLPANLDRTGLKAYWRMDEKASGTLATGYSVMDWSNSRSHCVNAGSPVYASDPTTLPFRTMLFDETMYNATIY